MLNKPHPLSIANKAPVTPITGNIKLTIIVFVRLTEKFANHLLVFGCLSLRSGLTISKIALSIGANIIERHFTLDRTSEGPDHILSSEPEEISILVDFSNRLNVILGDGVKKVQATEYETYNLQRKSLYASANIKKGQIIEKNLIQVKGPSGGIMPKFLNIVEGRVAQRDIYADYPITWSDI